MNFKIGLLLFCLLSLLSIIPLQADVAADGNDDEQIKTVLFPFRRAVVSSMVDSKILEYKFKEGERFKPGDLIIRIEDNIYLENFNKAQAAGLEAKTNTAFAERNYTRTLDMYHKGFQGKQELEKAELERDTAKAKEEYAVANMKLAKISLESCRIIAPFIGRMTDKLVQEHEFVKTGQPLVNIIDDTQLLAVIHLPSSVKNQVREGNIMKVKIDETGTVHSGKVYEAAGEIDPGSRTFEVKILIDNADGKLTAGMSGILLDGRIQSGARDGTVKKETARPGINSSTATVQPLTKVDGARSGVK